MTALLRRLPKFCIYTSLALAMLVGALVLGLRYWFLPSIENYRNDIIKSVSQATGARVEIGGIRADWEGLHPNLELDRVQVFDTQNNPALELVKVKTTLSWRSILAGAVRLRTLEIIQPNLEIKRDKSGKLYVAGIVMGGKQEGGSFSDLLLSARSVYIRGAVVSWEDQFRGAPPLVLDNLSLHLENRGSRHRFGLTATPPTQLAGSIDLRGEVRGTNISDTEDWSGKLYAELPYAEGGSWRSYVPLPKAFQGGRGAIRLWLDFKGAVVQSLIADVKLSDTTARLNENLPALDLASLDGRIRYRATDGGFEIASENLSLITRGETRTGSTQFLFRSEPKRDNEEAKGEFRANHLELAAWASLTDYLPLDKKLKEKIAAFAPNGQVNDLTFTWTGELTAPLKYAITGHIERGAVNSVDGYPGVIGLAASVNGNETGGSISIETARQVNFPHAFKAPLPIDKLTAKIKWEQSAGYKDIELRELTFANGQIAGSASGKYRDMGDKPGIIDFNGRFDRFDGRYIAFYLPSILRPVVREWLEGAIQGGNVSQATLRVVGDMNHFPFPDEKNGQFLLNVKLSDGILKFAEAWPSIKNIRGDVTLRGHGLEVKASEGTILGAKLSSVVATVSDLLIAEPLLTVTGEATGPVAEKIRFINESPVNEMLGGFTEHVNATGTGKLVLKLGIPIHNPEATRVNGDYQFQRAGLDFGPGSPPITDINGHLQFTEAGVTAPKMVASIFGGPALLNIATRPDKSIGLDGSGTASVDAVRAFLGHPMLNQVSGTAQWQGHMDVRNGNAILTVASPLTGVISNLPEPLYKTAAQEMPFTFERRSGNGKSERISIALGNLVFGEFERVDIPGREGASLKRGAVSFAKRAVLPAEDGLWFSGTLHSIDVDRWREVLTPRQSATVAGKGDTTIAGVDLSASSAKVFDRTFADVHLVAKADRGNWQGSITSQEMAGKFTWQPAGKGMIFARLSRLIIPDETQSQAAPSEPDSSNFDFPALDIVADQLQLKNRKLGQLELKAEQHGKDWRIQYLGLSQAGAKLDASGLWSRGTKSETHLKLKLDAPNAGKLLDELGFVNSVRNGNAILAGDLTWPGAPYEMTPAKLSGSLTLEASSGQFLKVEPGAGRLLGLMSLQSLPRRITLDFRDIFSEGFAFDTIAGDMNVRAGVLNTKNFAISGPAAKVEMFGDVDIGQETQRLQVRVFPTVGEGVSLASGILGGPVVAVTAFILQKVFKDPLSRAVAYEYNVTGTWDNPNVVKMERKSSNEVTQ
ncbi:MAG: YhdP family protein [Pseudomonadota bacterium]